MRPKEMSVADYSDDTPYECSRYAYSPAGERVAFVNSDVHADAQRHGHKGHKAMRIMQPFRDTGPDERMHVSALGTMVVTPMLWRHRSHSDAWGIQLESDADVARYLEWFPSLSLKERGDE
jgi:hypothetical protein